MKKSRIKEYIFALFNEVLILVLKTTILNIILNEVLSDELNNRVSLPCVILLVLFVQTLITPLRLPKTEEINNYTYLIEKTTYKAIVLILILCVVLILKTQT